MNLLNNNNNTLRSRYSLLRHWVYGGSLHLMCIISFSQVALFMQYLYTYSTYFTEKTYILKKLLKTSYNIFPPPHACPVAQRGVFGGLEGLQICPLLCTVGQSSPLQCPYMVLNQVISVSCFFSALNHWPWAGFPSSFRVTPLLEPEFIAYKYTKISFKQSRCLNTNFSDLGCMTVSKFLRLNLNPSVAQ